MKKPKIIDANNVNFSKSNNAPPSDVLSLPMFSEKLVIAHNMTPLIHNKKYGNFSYTGEECYFSPKGKTQAIGGLYQHQSLLNAMGIEQTLEQAVEYEMRTAIAMGLDGFQFWYVGRGSDELLDKKDKIIETYIAVAETKKIDFKISLCICNPGCPEKTQKQIEERLAIRIKNLLAKTNNSEKWLRTPDGRLVTFLWLPNAILDASRHNKNLHQNPTDICGIATAFYRIAALAGEPEMAYVYHLKQIANQEALQGVIDNFPAIWGWVEELDDQHDHWRNVAKLCKKHHRSYTQSVYPGYYTSKVYDKHWDGKTGRPLINSAEEAAKRAPESLERHQHVTNLTTALRQNYHLAVETNADIINYITWNDYPEGHHLAPDINSYFSYGVLLNYYKQLWKDKHYLPEKDIALVFYKKYPSYCSAKYEIDVKQRNTAWQPEDEDRIEVIALLKKPADIYCNGQILAKGNAGINVLSAPLELGEIAIEIKRNNNRVVYVTPPIEITDQPLRTDRLTVGYSSECQALYRNIFGHYNIAMPIAQTFKA